MSVSTAIEIDGGVLVAHDGSAQASAAVRTGVRFAVALGKPVMVVRAWNLSNAPRPTSAAPGYMPPFEDFEAATLTALENDLEPIRSEHPEVTLTAAVVHGSPAEKLIDASARADLIVVGSRGHGGFAGLLLGSVSEQVVRHAACPVLVDRPARRDDRSADEVLDEALASELKLD